MNETTLKLLAKALEADPSDWDTRHHLAELYLEAGQGKEAADLIEKAPLALETESEALRGAELLAKADSERALAFLDQLLEQNKACAPAHWLKARIYQDTSNRELARKHYNVAAVIDESLQDEAFEAWLDNEASPPVKIPVPAQGADAPGLKASGTSSPTADDETGSEDGQPEEDYVETDGALDELFSNKPAISFEDVGGMEDLKERIRMKIVYPFKNKSVFAKFKKTAGGGLLLYGPPGCGKTLMARATAGECDAFFNTIAVSDVLSRWLGESEARLHQVFEAARRRRPAVVFIDEVDALGLKRSEASGALGTIINVLLTEIDGASSDNDGILVIGATNTPWRVDNAFRRPGRFEKTLFVPPPDEAARLAIFELLLKDMPTEKVDLKKLVKITDRFSGADLRSIVENAVEAAIAEEMKTGKSVVLTQRMLLKAAKNTRCTTLEWLEQATNYASYANQSGVYDELSEYLKM
ncbi:MAG: AAA family ATPase [Verrucomicrobiota bacterium]